MIFMSSLVLNTVIMLYIFGCLCYVVVSLVCNKCLSVMSAKVQISYSVKIFFDGNKLKCKKNTELAMIIKSSSE
jgi:hypothetical protein